MLKIFRWRSKAPADTAGDVMLHTVKDIVHVASLSGAAELDFSKVGVYDLTQLPSEIGALERISTLNLSRAGICSIAPLSGLTQLKTLDLSHCRNLSDISPLFEMTELSELDLSKSQVTNIEVLRSLKGLRSLYLQGCRISDLSPLTELTELEHLDLANSQVTDLSVLRGHASLKSLNLWNTHILDFTPLATLIGLEGLDLWNTQISDLSSLARLTNLTYLDLSHTKIADLSPIRDLPNLEQLALWNTPFQEEGIATGQYQGRWYDSGLLSDAADGDLEAVKARVARGAMIMEDQWDGPIHWAIRNGRTEVCRFLVALEPSIVNDSACYDGVYEAETPLALAIDHQHSEIVELLLKHGAKMSVDEDGHNF